MKVKETIDWNWRAEQHEQWRQSGLSLKAYCAQIGLDPVRMTSWRKALRQKAQRAQTATNKRTGAKVVAVQVKAIHPEAGLRLISPSGWQVCLPAGVDLQALVPLLQQLR